jgi:competence ComEA-like helix-hairpin-helix protein
MWKKILSWAHALGFTANETTVVLFLTGTILAGAAIQFWRTGFPKDTDGYAEAYRLHDSLFAARSGALFGERKEARNDDTTETDERPVPPSHVSNPVPRIVNINTASASMLESLPGVGPATAARIVEYRNTTGEFLSIEDIMNVQGIGPKKFERMKAFLSIN